MILLHSSCSSECTCPFHFRYMCTRCTVVRLFPLSGTHQRGTPLLPRADMKGGATREPPKFLLTTHDCGWSILSCHCKFFPSICIEFVLIGTSLVVDGVLVIVINVLSSGFFDAVVPVLDTVTGACLSHWDSSPATPARNRCQ